MSAAVRRSEALRWALIRLMAPNSFSFNAVVLFLRLACGMGYSMLPVRAGGKLQLSTGPILWLNHKCSAGSIMVKPKKRKPKRGRPFKGGRNPIIGIRLDPDETADVDGLAKEAGVSRSEMLRRLIAL